MYQMHHQQVPFRPFTPSPMLGQQRKVMAQTFDQILNITPATGDVIRLAFHGLATYIGVWVGLNANKVKTGNKTVKKLTAGLGWILAGGHGLGAIADVVSLIKRITGTHPPDAPSPPVPSTAPLPQ